MENFIKNQKTFLKGLKNILGVGIYLLLIGMILEILTINAMRWISFPISVSKGMQISLTLICVIFCLMGMIWFNKTLNLIEINLAGGENRLMTYGPFNYVRHPLYATLLITLPPLLVIWFKNLVFIVPWVLMYFISHFLIQVEEKNLVRIFGDEYIHYKQFVPELFPYKGANGLRFRKYSENMNIENEYIMD